MRGLISSIFDDTSAHVRSKIIAMFVLLAGFNIAAWVWALMAFRDHPVLLGTAFLAYSFGLRHAVDADHIAAIDNVTRKLMQEGERPVGVGLCFSLGHSTIVILASIAVAATATAFKDQIEAIHGIGGFIGTVVSSLFLLGIALVNLFVFLGVYRTFRHVKRGGAYVEEDFDLLMSGGGFIARIVRPLFHMIERSWHMYFLGFLFGLGFDTATEVGLLGISAAEGGHGLPIWSILVFPVLFTAGMALVDAADSVLMLSVYGWAFLNPIRKLYYNMTITAVSVLVAVVVGTLETLNLIGDQLGLTDGGGFWGSVGALNDNFGTLGYIIVGIFILSWLASMLVYRIKGYGQLELAGPGGSTAAE